MERFAFPCRLRETIDQSTAPRRVGNGGTISAYAGTRRSGGEGDGSAPQQAQLSLPEDVTVAPDGSVQERWAT